MSENQTVQFDPQDVADNKVFGVLAYFGILFLVPLLAKKESQYCRFHANQGLLLCIGWVAMFIVVTILGFIPVVGALISLVLYIALIVCFVLGIVHAVKGEAKGLPFIGGITLIK